MTERDSSARGPLAVFDVDGTLFRRGLLPELTRRLVNEGVFSELVREELSRDSYAQVERRGSYETYDTLVFELFLRELEGVPVTEVRRCARVEVEAHGRRLHIYTRDVARRLKQAGYHLIAISGSPQEILDLFLEPLSFDRAWGTVLGHDAGGSYTGEMLQNPFENKRRVLEQFLESSESSLEGSVGIGDTLSDVGFLEMVQKPIAFNPNSSLFGVARQRGWSVVVERKDVIYNLHRRLEDPERKCRPRPWRIHQWYTNPRERRQTTTKAFSEGFIQNGSFGYRQSDNVVFQRLKTSYLQAYSAFGEERRRETLEKYERSSYIELQRRVFPNNPDKDDCLEALKRLRHRMILFKLSYRGRGIGYAFVDLKNRYPEAHEAFIRDLES